MTEHSEFTKVGVLSGVSNWNEETARLDYFEDSSSIDGRLLANIKGKRV